MKRPNVLSAAILCAGLLLGAAGAGTRLAYPAAPRGAVTETYFGTAVPDPYRWLEEIDAPQTVAWRDAENALTRAYLDAVPQRAAIRARLQTLIDYPKVGAPFRRGAHWFAYRNTGLQNQSVLYTMDRAEGDPGRVLIDPNTLAADGTVSLGSIGFPEDGRYVAYATQSSGSDWLTWHVRDVATGADLADTLEWSKFSGASWRGDDGFYYARFDAPADGKLLAAVGTHKLFYHRLGTPQSADRLVFAPPDPNWFVGGEVTRDGRYLEVEASRGSARQNRLWLADLTTGDDAHLTPVFDTFEAEYGTIDHDGSRFYLVTTKDAPRKRIVWFDAADPAHVLHEIVPQHDEPIAGATLLGATLYVEYLKDAHSAVERFALDGKALGAMTVPGIGTMGLPSARREDPIAYYGYSSYGTPPTTYRYDVKTGASSIYYQPTIAFDPAQFVTEQVFYRSKDGTRVPMFVTHRRDLRRDGTAPTILYGYGGFNIPLTPGFSFPVAAWLQLGGVYAVANLRGGSEYGEAWHEAGRLERKQNVFDDFIAAAQNLIDTKVTSTPRLAISGGSNGGLLVAACLVQRPDLFGAALPDVGVLDMLRYQKFTAGKAWTGEYGAAEASAEQFKTLLAYSPVQNAKPGVTYPPTLIHTADHDDRVFPAHSYKFAAALQYAQAGDAPILLSVESKAGHGGGKPISKAIDDYADEFAFLVRALNFTPSL